MLGASTEAVRGVIRTLAERRELSAETFLFAQSAWRVAPSDVARIHASWKETYPEPSGPGEEGTPAAPKRRVVRRVRRETPESSGD